MGNDRTGFGRIARKHRRRDCRGTRRRRPEAQRGGAGDLAGIASRPRERPSQPICARAGSIFRLRRPCAFMPA